LNDIRNSDALPGTLRQKSLSRRTAKAGDNRRQNSEGCDYSPTRRRCGEICANTAQGNGYRSPRAQRSGLLAGDGQFSDERVRSVAEGGASSRPDSLMRHFFRVLRLYSNSRASCLGNMAEEFSVHIKAERLPSQAELSSRSADVRLYGMERSGSARLRAAQAVSGCARNRPS
jgi:hypothetical protein